MFFESFPEKKKKASVHFHTDLRQKNVKTLLSKFWILLPNGERGRARTETTKERG